MFNSVFVSPFSLTPMINRNDFIILRMDYAFYFNFDPVVRYDTIGEFNVIRLFVQDRNTSNKAVQCYSEKISHRSECIVSLMLF